MKTPVISMIYVLVGSFFGSFGAVFLKAGSNRIHKTIRSIYTNWPLAVGILLYGLSSVFFLLGVRRGELSILYPLVSLGSVWTLVWSRIFFKEPLTREKLTGLGLVLLGIAFLGIGNQIGH
jgi:multidrug transporter EmrE-like cation transporter